MSRAVARKIEHFGMARFTPHDLRRTATSHLSGMKLPEIVVRKLLNHAAQGVTQRTYNQYTYEDEKREALQSYNNWLDSLDR